MRVAITGSSGLVGAALVSALTSTGHDVTRLVRRAPADTSELRWDADSTGINADQLEVFDVVVHLAGEPIAQRWSTDAKRRIRSSRVGPTTRLAEAIAACPQRRPALICASAVGYYGNRGDETVDETAPPGDGFLSETCVEWEQACDPARRAGARVVNLRTGIVLSRSGGALARMLTPFRLGAGGPIAGGRQWISFISLTDAAAAIRMVIERHDLDGPINLAAPTPIRNRDFTRELGRAVHRPAVVPLPAFAVRLAFGEMGVRMLAEGQRVVPGRLDQAGFVFTHPTLPAALASALAE
jgi:uncharacterized protein